MVSSKNLHVFNCAILLISQNFDAGEICMFLRTDNGEIEFLNCF